LEARIASGSQDPAVYNALAKIFIDSNNNPEAFLKENNIYEPLVVGKYCEKRDPTLAFIAYAKGFCDDELITITNDNGMFKNQARYLVKRRRLELWAQVLSSDNDHRRQLIDQVIATALPECTDPDDVSVTVKAFIVADLPIELIELLEKIIIETSPFSDNKNLQNLLILTAIRADKGKVVGYINKLSNYDYLEIAKIATEQGLYEEALTVYKKYDQHALAMNVLVENIVSIDRGLEYANKVNLPEVWSRLAKAQLDGLRIKDAIDSYIKADDPANFAEVIEIASHAGKQDDLVRFLQMARKTLREPKIDTELAYAYAKAAKLLFSTGLDSQRLSSTSERTKPQLKVQGRRARLSMRLFVVTGAASQFSHHAPRWEFSQSWLSCTASASWYKPAKPILLSSNLYPPTRRIPNAVGPFVILTDWIPDIHAVPCSKHTSILSHSTGDAEVEGDKGRRTVACTVPMQDTLLRSTLERFGMARFGMARMAILAIS